MKTSRIAWILLLAGCASALPPKAPPVDPTETLMLSARKVDYAVAQTKRMIQRSRGADYLPDLYLRLAGLYTERARYAWLVVYEQHKAKGDDRRALDAPEARLLKNLAIGTYDRIVKDFPKYPRDDESLFLEAHEYRELGEFDSMRTTYEKLIESYPRSPHRLEAYLILGDTAFDKNDLSRAEQYYNLVLAAPESHVHSLARYKLAWVRVNREDCKGAVRLFEKILRDKATPTGQKSLIVTQRSLNVARESLVDLAYCYPEVYPDKPAAPYFRALAANSSDYIAAMRRAANRFFIKQMFTQAAGALREVIASASDEDAVEMARKLYDNLIKGKVFDAPAADVERIGRVLENRYFDYRLPKDKREKLRTEFEVYARDIATKAQLAARSAKGTALHGLAADAYTMYLSYFPNSAARLEMEQNRAESLLQAERYLEAGQAFEKVDGLIKEKEPRKQARLNAISAYQQALDKGGLTRTGRLIAWGGIRAVGREVIADDPNEANIVSIKLSIARGYYDSGEYERAAELFYALVRQYPTSNEASVSGHLALDALRLAENLEGLATIGRRMIADSRIADAKFKDEVKDIVAKAEQRQVTEITVSAGNEREEQLLSFAKRHKGSELGEQALYNTLLVARSNGEIDRFYELGGQYIESYPKSPRRTEVLTALAAVSTDSADYGQAAQFLEAAYAADPSGKDAMERLQAAASIRSALGDPAASGDLRKLIVRGAKVDELLVMMAQSGNLTAVEELLGNSPASGAVASFLRGYLAYQRGDRDEASKLFADAAHERAEGEAGVDSVAKAKFYLGEIALDQFNAQAPSGDIVKQVTGKAELLGAVDKAYSLAIASRDAQWALASLARVSEAYGRFAAFLKDLHPPDDLSPDDKKALEGAISAKADEAQKRSTELRNLCAKRAKETNAFSDTVRSCLSGENFPDKIPAFGHVTTKRGSDPPGAQQLRLQLLKSPRNGEILNKLADLYLGAGDLGMAMLILDRAEEVEPKSSAVQNLRGVALYRIGNADASFEAFRKAVQLDGKNQRARLNLAAHYAFYGYHDKAKAELNQAGGSFVVRGDAAEHPELGSLSKIAPGGKK